MYSSQYCIDQFAYIIFSVFFFNMEPDGSKHVPGRVRGVRSLDVGAE